MKKLLFIVILFPLALGLFGAFSLRKESKSLKPKVLVSIPPYLYFVEKIAGDSVEAISLAPEGVNPHLYEPTPKQVELVHQSKVWIRLNESFEKKIYTTLTEQHPDLLILDLTKSVPLLGSSCEDHSEHHCSHHDHSEEAQDLHIWMSPKLAKIQATAISQVLAQAFPEKAEIFTAKLQVFLEELDSLDTEIDTLLKPFKDDAILVSHPAFGYFCQDYHLEQVSVEMEGKDPLPQHITSMLEKAKSSHIRLVLIQAQYNNKGAEMLAHELHLPTYNVDPYSSKYVETLKDIAQNIANNP